MKHGRAADFFFVGLGVIPAALLFGGLPHLAILLFFPLLFAACAFGMAEQLGDENTRAKDDGASSAGSASRGNTPGLNFRKRSPRE